MGDQDLRGKQLFVNKSASCLSSHLNVAKYEAFILSQGATLTEQMEEADLVLIDTCAFSKSTETHSLDLLKRGESSAKPGAKVIACGCLTAMNPVAIEQNFSGLLFSPKNPSHLSEILGVGRAVPSIGDVGVAHKPALIDKHTRWRHRFHMRGLERLHRWNHRLPLERIPHVRGLLNSTINRDVDAYTLQILQGCVGSCTFCTIPMAKGRTVSAPLGMIVATLREQIEKGRRRFILMGEDTGSYGIDTKATIVDLLQKLHDINEDFELFIFWFDPRWLPQYGEALLPLLEKGRIRFVQFPLQSASNSVLERMKRAYLMEEVEPLLRKYKQKVPKLTLGTQLIVGFPGETESEFQETRAFLKRNRRLFSQIDFFDYSDRPGAASTKMDGKIPASEKRRRTQTLKACLPYRTLTTYRTEPD